jgi:hypothetical protein
MDYLVFDVLFVAQTVNLKGGRYMEEEIDRSVTSNRSVPGWVIAAVAVLGVIALVGLVMAHNASMQAQEAQQNFDNKVKAVQADFTGQIAQLQQHEAQVDTANAGLQSDLTVVTKRLRLTQSDLKKARDEAETIRTEDQQKIAEVDASAKTELATKASTDEVKSVDGKVDGVRTDLSGTQNDLKMARSELGTLIARNHEDVEQLRRLGERDYIEFTIDGKNKPQKVGSFMVELRGTNPNKKRYNVALIVDDSRIEKKNLPVNEPIFFHQGTDRRPLELVVNSVTKDKVTGYISIPKAAGAQSASSD